ncbi:MULTISPECIES: Rha family transcriptional regulator [Paenibacillus]|uniref:Rha family phage regulatory protein n=1 Tax=Paenibacillus peoriae TaxID=59893 RepID=A0ABU1Q9D9_9BACL|nr:MULTISPECIES: Rha family transcriptional regulator [Paenibacillus]MDR6776249.1 Rha family phage regulatory protein [Paenibacillus peoriae]
MSKLILNTEFNLYEKSGRAYCTSRQVAEEFEKEHKNVLRDIESLDCSEQFNRLNFEPIKYKDSKGRSYKEYLISKDGFVFLIMGYRGKKAARFKEAYIQRFNDMEYFIKSLQATRLEFPAFTSAINDSHEVPKSYHFTNEIDMINRIVLGITAKQVREEKGVKAGESIRPYLSAEQIKSIETLQRVDIGLLISTQDFQVRKKILSDYFNRLVLSKKLIA